MLKQLAIHSWADLPVPCTRAMADYFLRPDCWNTSLSRSPIGTQGGLPWTNARRGLMYRLNARLTFAVELDREGGVPCRCLFVSGFLVMVVITFLNEV